MLAALDPKATTASRELIERAGLSDEAIGQLDAEANLRRNIDALMAAGLPADAIRVIAQALPKNYAVAWASSCLKRLLDPDSPGDDGERDAVRTVEAWLADPSEKNRQASLDLAEARGFATAGCWIAAAAGWSGGSLAPKGYTQIPPPDAVTGHAVHGALQLTAARRGAEMPAALREFVDEALKAFGTASKSPRRGDS
jgi:hypothetical protein